MKLLALAVTAATALTVSVQSQAWDLKSAAAGLKKLQDAKNGNASAGAQEQGNPPTWNKLFFATMKSQPKWAPEKVVNQYWIAMPESTYSQYENNEFELEGQRAKIMEEKNKGSAEYKPQTFDYVADADLGKYDFTKKGFPIDQALNEDGLLQSLSGRDGITQLKPSMSTTPNPVPQEESWQTVPTSYLFKVTNPQFLKFVPVDQEIAKGLGQAMSGNRGVELQLKFDIVKIDVADKKYNQYGTIGVAHVKVVEAKVVYKNVDPAVTLATLK